MIVKKHDGWHVESETKGKDGKHKNLGGPYATKRQAVKRLREVEFFKHKG